MNTITIMSTVEGTPNVTYTEGEVLRYIEKAKGIDELNDLLNKQYQTIRSIKENVRDFFSEVEWEDGEQTVTKSDVNELLGPERRVVWSLSDACVACLQNNIMLILLCSFCAACPVT